MGTTRAVCSRKTRLLRTFEAESYFEAMTKYNEFLGREPYTTDQMSDHTPYTDQWLQRQLAPYLSGHRARHERLRRDSLPVVRSDPRAGQQLGNVRHTASQMVRGCSESGTHRRSLAAKGRSVDCLTARPRFLFYTRSDARQVGLVADV
jgi:hypothetical protein